MCFSMIHGECKECYRTSFLNSDYICHNCESGGYSNMKECCSDSDMCSDPNCNQREKDKLEIIFDLQNDLNKMVLDKLYHEGYWDRICDLDASFAKKFDSDRAQWLLNYNRAQIHESMEFEDSVGWKWWAKQDTDIQNLKVELVDELHFFISKCLLLGISPLELFNLYKKKLKLNYDRQKEGYMEGKYKKVKDGKEDNKGIK